MKIYHKKSFAEGILMLALGTLLFITDLINHSYEIKGAVLIFALYFFGGELLVRSLSRKLTREDRLDQMDERNQLIEWKSKRKAFQLTQILSFVLMLVLLVIGKISGIESLIAIAVGLAFAFAISMLTEVFSFMYYESKNENPEELPYETTSTTKTCER